MRSSRTPDHDPLTTALARKASTGRPGATETTPLAAGDGWRVVDVVCTSGPDDVPFEERQTSTTISLVLAGTFVYRSDHGRSLLSPGAFLLGNAGDRFECSHQHGAGDRCLSFQFDLDVFDGLAHDAGAARAVFACDRVPPLRSLAAVSARAELALAGRGSLEELSLQLAGAVVRLATDARRDTRPTPPNASDRIARVLRRLECRIDEPVTLADLAASAGLSRYHFLRTFKDVTGVTPHQWVLRRRLRAAAHRLVATREHVTDIALDVGFDDLSNFIRSFRAEFGVSPRRYRAAA